MEEFLQKQSLRSVAINGSDSGTYAWKQTNNKLFQYIEIKNTEDNTNWTAGWTAAATVFRKLHFVQNIWYPFVSNKLW